MTKHKIGMVTKNTPFLVTVIFLDKVKQYEIFTTISGEVCLFSVVIGNRYLLRGNKESVLSITIIGNITMSS